MWSKHGVSFANSHSMQLEVDLVSGCLCVSARRNLRRWMGIHLNDEESWTDWLDVRRNGGYASNTFH